MIIDGKAYALVNETTENGIVYAMYRSDEDKKGHDMDDCVIISHPENEILDSGYVASKPPTIPAVLAQPATPFKKGKNGKPDTPARPAIPAQPARVGNKPIHKTHKIHKTNRARDWHNRKAFV